MRQHRTADAVANSINVLDACPAFIVHNNKSALIELDVPHGIDEVELSQRVDGVQQAGAQKVNGVLGQINAMGLFGWGEACSQCC